MSQSTDRPAADGGATTFMTGASGFVGRELLHHLLHESRTVRLVALLRAPDEATLAERRQALVKGLSPTRAQRVDVVPGDMTAPHFGLDARRYAALVETTDRVIHCAASTRFDLTLTDARRDNVDSTAHVLALCRAIRSRGGSGRLDHVSTAFVAGRRQGLVGEDELDAGQTFHNTYERTKLEAEQLCRDARGDLPIVIHRPSIVVGKRSSGETTSYKAAYGPMRLLVNTYNRCPSVLNRLVPLPFPPNLAVDLVPVDYVAATIATLWAREDAVGRCYHLAAGPDGAATLRELVYLACDHFKTPRLRFLEPRGGLQALGRLLAGPLQRLAPRAANMLGIMYAYGLCMPTFDTSNARAAGLASPPVLQYFELILRFATQTGFGRGRAAAHKTSAPAAASESVPLPTP